MSTPPNAFRSSDAQPKRGDRRNLWPDKILMSKWGMNQKNHGMLRCTGVWDRQNGLLFSYVFFIIPSTKHACNLQPVWAATGFLAYHMFCKQLTIILLLATIWATGCICVGPKKVRFTSAVDLQNNSYIHAEITIQRREGTAVHSSRDVPQNGEGQLYTIFRHSRKTPIWIVPLQQTRKHTITRVV